MYRDRIKATYADLSPSFQRLADYVSDYYFQVAFMTATQLGKELDVDTATVVRFAQRLGYNGYPDLLDELQAEVKLQLSHYFHPPAMNGFESAGWVRRSTIQDVNNIEQLTLMLDDAVMMQAADLIDQVERILIIGEDLVEPLADLLARSLRTLNYDAVQLRGPASHIATQFRSLNRNYLVIALSVSAYCPDATSAVEVAHDLKARTLAFAGARSWAVARGADQVITCPSASPTTMPSLTSFSAAINALLQLLAHHRHDEQVEMSVKYNDVLRRLAETHSRVELDAAVPLTRSDNYAYPAPAFVSQSMRHENDHS